MQKYPNKGFFIGFRENCLFSENFRKGYSMAIFMLTAKKLIYTNLAIFSFSLSNKHDSFGFRKFCLKLIEKITKKQNIMITNICFSIFCIFLKNRRLWLHLQCRNELCMQKHPNKGIFIGFRENCLFSENFRKGYINFRKGYINFLVVSMKIAMLQPLQHGEFHANDQKIDIYYFDYIWLLSI